VILNLRKQMFMTRYLCVAFAAAATLSAPEGSSLEKFEEKMKKKWDSILEKHPLELASTTDVPEALAAPTAFPLSEQHILDSLRKLDGTTAAPAELSAALDDLKVAVTTAAPTVDISATLADLKARLHEEELANTAVPLAATAAPDAEVSDLLANLHQHIHDVHSSVHNVLDGSLSHPGIKPAVDSLALHDDATTDDDAKDTLMPKDLAEEAEDAPSKDADAASAPGDTDSAEEGAVQDASAVSSEHAAAMHGMKQLMGAVKMIVMLQPMLEPLKEKLTLALKHMSPEDAAKAKGILKHIKALDLYSKVTASLMAGVVAAKSGSEQDREKAVATLIVGVKQIQDKVAKHLLEMKQETQALPQDAPADEASPAEAATESDHANHANHAEVAMDKMTALLVKLGKKIAQEIKDPANRHNPKVLLDIKLFLAVKESVEKTQALMMAGSIAIKKAKTSEEKSAVQAAVKRGMGKVEATLKSKMMALEKQALMLAVAAAKQQESEKAEATSGDRKSDKDDSEADEDDDAAPAKAEEAKKKKAEEAKADDDDDTEDDSADDDASTKKKKADASSKKKKAPAKAKEDDDDDVDDDKAPENKKKEPKHHDAKADAEGDSHEEDLEEEKAEGPEDEEEAPATKPKKPAEAKADAEKTEDAAKRNHPEISASDIEHIFEEAADDATSDSKKGSALEEEAVHLRTH